MATSSLRRRKVANPPENCTRFMWSCWTCGICHEKDYRFWAANFALSSRVMWGDWFVMRSRPKSVLHHSLSVCICLLDPKQLVASSYQAFKGHASHGSSVIVSQDTVWCLLEGLGMLLLLLFGGMILYHP
nr:PREDICTED: uncharacterized protein LOC108952344 isoform X1 [Musa acuminata subsp. malaccensis]